MARITLKELKAQVTNTEAKDQENKNNNENSKYIENTGIRSAQNLTLRQLKSMLPSTAGQKRPTFKALREGTSKVILQTDVSDSSISVYDSGFAVYQKPGHYGVLRVDMIGSVDYEYGSFEGVRTESVSLDDTSWEVALYLDGEERLELQYQKRASRVGSLSKLGVVDDEEDGDNELDVDSGVDIEGEYIRQIEKEEAKLMVDKLLSCLTDRQREIVTMYYLEGMTQRAVADQLCIPQQYVDRVLKASKKKMKNFF